MKKVITTGSDFSGVGAFDYAIGRIAEQKGFKHERVFACDWDKYARITYAHNHGTPEYYPQDVYDRTIPEDSLDIYMTSPPCQSFSLAGNRKGKNSENGVLFFNSHEFIKKNKPRFFIFENVKGLLSDDSGRTFQEWLNYLGGKSINGLPILFKDDNAVEYHVYWKVLNSKKHGVPQNRERVFIIGIRDDQDNYFTWPKEEHLSTRLKDVLETEVDSKYFLSNKAVEQLIKNGINENETDGLKLVGNTHPSGNGMNRNVFDSDGISPTLSTNKGEGIKVVQLNQSKESGGVQPYQQNRIYDSKGISPALCKDKSDLCVQVKSGTKRGFEIAKEGDSINFERPNSKTRKGRVGKQVAQTLDTVMHQGYYSGFSIRRLTPRECFRLQDFPESFEFVVSDSQLYKQAGNSITVRVLELILFKLDKL